jgi:hypothetical protein
VSLYIYIPVSGLTSPESKSDNRSSDAVLRVEYLHSNYGNKVTSSSAPATAAETN